MKKLYLLLSILIFLCSSPSIYSATIKHHYHFPAPVVHQQSDGMSLVYFENCYQAGKVGEPTLPFVPISMLLPPGHAVENYRFIFKGKRKIEQRVILSPKQAPRKSVAPITTQRINQDVYNSADVYSGFEPGFQTHYFFGHSVALACFSPVEYIPADGELYYYSDVEVEITTQPDDKAMQAQQNYRSSKAVVQQLAKIVDNFEQVIGCYTEQNDEPSFDYLVITINDFIDDYQPLAKFYNARGIRTKIVSVEDIYQAEFGNDEPEKIRNYIIDEAQNYGISFVLLAGDADLGIAGEMQVPIRGLYCHVLSGEDVYEDNNIPSDLYYSALDGSWNKDDDDRWGEPGEDDLLPELAVARICADDSVEIRAVINKVIAYLSRPVVKDATKMLMLGEYMWGDPLSYGADYLDLLIGPADENGYSTFGMPVDLNFTFLYDRTLGSWSTDDVIKAINNGCNIIHHAGHSSSSSNMRMSRSHITNENFMDVDGISHLNPIVYSHGCETAKVDAVDFLGRDCIAEIMLAIDNFASAYIGNTRYGWFNEGQTEGPSLHLHREFISALYGDSVVAIGAAHTLSRIRSAPFVTAPDQWEPGALRWCFYGCNVLGDPAMSIWTNQIHEFSSVEFPTEISSLPAELSIETGVANARVAISSGGNLLATTLTNSTGQALLSIDSPSIVSALKITITALNYEPFVGTINLQSTGIDNSNRNHEISYQLKPLFPNPFNSETTIQFSITRVSEVKLEIFNLKGQKIRTLYQGILQPGLHHINWNGQNDFGNAAATGLYFVKLISDEGIRIKNCVLLK